MKNVTSETFSRHSEKLIWTKEEYETEAETRILSTGRVLRSILVLKVNTQIVKRSCPQEVRKIVSQKSGTLRWRKIKKYLPTM